MANNPTVITQALDEIFPDSKPLHTRKYAATVVSILPYEINEDKPHMLPSSFRVPAAEYKDSALVDIAILHVEEGIHYVPDAILNRSLKQITPPDEMARSIVEDYVTSHICLSENGHPGLFWVEGRLTKAEIKKYHATKIKEVENKQRNWFHALCVMADADWQKNHNMQAVSDLQRLAARCLGVRKDWAEFTMAESKPCPFCKFAISLDSIKCMNCKEIVDQKAYDKLTGKKED